MIEFASHSLSTSNPCYVRLTFALSVPGSREPTCVQIQPPGWLDATWLKDIHRREVEDGAFQEMPPHYLEIAHTMMQVASDDIQDVEGVCTGSYHAFRHNCRIATRDIHTAVSCL